MHTLIKLVGQADGVVIEAEPQVVANEIERGGRMFQAVRVGSDLRVWFNVEAIAYIQDYPAG